ILSLLKFMDSPVDDLSFANFISGEIFLSATGIKRGPILEFMFRKNISPETRAEYLYQHFRNAHEFAQTWQNYFDEIYKKIGFLSLYEIIALCFEKFEIFRNFPDEAAFLIRFLEVVSLLQAQGINNVRDFLEFALDNDEESSQIFSVILPEYVNAVRIMTFHKAKGLGFPVVINMIYDEKGETSAMYFHETEPGVIKVFYIKKDFAEKSSVLNKIHASKKLDENVQNLNLLYVITTRAKNEMYNLIIRKARKKLPKALAEKLTDVFEDEKMGKPSKKKPEKVAKAETCKVFVSGTGYADMEPLSFADSRKWTFQRYLESAEGEFYHEVLAKLEYLDNVSVELMGKIVEEASENYNFKFDRDRIKNALMDFLNIEKVREWFLRKEGRIIKTEVEFYGRREGLMRMDRVVFDRETISVIDFKTGHEEISEYENQIKKYVQVLREIYPGKKVQGYLAYIDLKKIKEYE
ncbi:MAG: 3'-5' exonuclease, partial [Elusimicrobiota bacterium]